MNPNKDKSQEFFSHNKRNSNLMRVGDTILASTEVARIDENWCLLENQSTCDSLINGNYISNIRDALDGIYLCVHRNAGVTYTNNIGDLPGYSNTFCTTQQR